MLDEPEKFTYASSLLIDDKKEKLRLALLSNIDVFSWSHSDMVGINPTVASHKLNIISTTNPVRQKVRHFHPDRHQIIQTEVDNLLREGFIREVKYLEWLANVVVVPKKREKWRVTNLNESCPKDNFLLSYIDQIVDSAVGHGIPSLLNAFSRYYQIPMHPPDAKITPHRLCCYNVMPFLLKNAGATYQRLVTEIF